jgi:hypothetical protein
MAIQSISRGRFTHCLPSHHALEQVIGMETEWFADTQENVIGTVAWHRGDNWGYAVLGRDGKTDFRVRKMKEHIRSRNAAVAQLLRAMEAAEHDGTQPVSRRKRKA